MNDQKKEPKLAGTKSIPLELKVGTYFYCTCGESLNQPFCDGAHKGSDFKPLGFSVIEDRKFGFCSCKRSCKEPFCDGSHKKFCE